MLVGVGDEDDVCVEVRGETCCFCIWLAMGALGEATAGGCTPVGGFWALLWGGADATATGEGEDEEVRVGVIAVNVGVWEGVEVLVRVV